LRDEWIDEIIDKYKAESEDMSEVGVEIIKTEEIKENGIKHLNINVSNDEVERNPDIVRLCADAGILEYVKPKTECSCDQIKWERDTAIAQLKELGYGLGEKPKTGHWEYVQYDSNPRIGNYHCSVCRSICISMQSSKRYKYCPNCGVKMESEG
jgi:PHP family Zn ribbon phosphoesterase